jgi:hypothetical protein
MSVKISTGLRNKLAGIYAEKVTNGGFSSATTGWTAVAGVLASVASGQSGNCLRITTNSANVAKAYQDITTKVGHVYIFGGYQKQGDGTGGRIMIGTTGDENAYYDSGDSNPASWTVQEFFLRATTTTTRITLQNDDTTNTGKTALFDTITMSSFMKSVQDVMKGCFLDVWSGAQPSSPDAPMTGTKLLTLFSDGSTTGLNFDDAVAGVLSKAVAETWSGAGIDTGVAGCWRLRTAGDSSNDQSEINERIDGTVALSGGDMTMSPSLNIVVTAIQTLSTFTVTVPIGA